MRYGSRVPGEGGRRQNRPMKRPPALLAVFRKCPAPLQAGSVHANPTESKVLSAKPFTVRLWRYFSRSTASFEGVFRSHFFSCDLLGGHSRTWLRCLEFKTEIRGCRRLAIRAAGFGPEADFATRAVGELPTAWKFRRVEKTRGH